MILALVAKLGLVTICEDYFLSAFKARKNSIFPQYLIQNCMSILKKVKHMLKASDFFYSTEMLRYDEEMQYRTLTGGIVSIGIIVTICIGFASMIMDTLNLQSISTTKQILKNIDPVSTNITTGQESHFMFGVQIWHVNLSDSSRYFDVTFTQIHQTNGIVYYSNKIPLQTCTEQHWKSYPYVIERFDTLLTRYWLCPPLGIDINLFGKYSSANYSQYKIEVSACKNQTDPLRPCKPYGEIQALFRDNADFLYFDFYFGNPVINSDQKDYKQYYLQDESYAIFGSSQGTQTFLYFSDYQIQTDYSIWPFSNIENDVGALAEDLAINHPFQTNINGTFISFSLAKSANSLVYKREVQKISSVFSFMGGMIGAVSAVLFIIKLYTNFSFEISIAHELFEPEQKLTDQKKSVEEKTPKEKQSFNDGQDSCNSSVKAQMNFCEFFQYHFYSAMKTLGKDLEWPKMRFLNECEKEVLKQLDVKALLKRVIFIEYCLTMIFEDYQLSGLQQNIPKTLTEIKGIRQKCASIIDDNNEKPQIEKSLIHSSMNSGNPLINYFNNDLQLPSANEHLHSPTMSRSIFSSGIVSAPFSNQVQIVDIINQKDSKHHPNSIVNVFHEESRTKSYLKELKKDVRKGNRLSSRIWTNLIQSNKINEGEKDENHLK